MFYLSFRTVLSNAFPSKKIVRLLMIATCWRRKMAVAKNAKVSNAYIYSVSILCGLFSCLFARNQ